MIGLSILFDVWAMKNNWDKKKTYLRCVWFREQNFFDERKRAKFTCF